METTRPRPRIGHSIITGLAALLVLATTTTGQAVLTSVPDIRGGSSLDVVRAEALEAQAGALFLENRPLAIARLFEQAAALRAEDDPERANSYRVAGVMYQRAGRLPAAVRNLTTAAEAYLANGDIVQAHQQFILAAMAAQEQQQPETVERLVRQAECLLNSPLLSPAEAEQLRMRIVRTGETPGH
jgi:tetratricopeptide (TPR) repeat protein